MEVILNQDINRLGKAGAVVKVRDGYANNFLIPNGLAVPMTAANLKKLEQEKLASAQQLEKLNKQAQDLAVQLNGVSLTMPALTHEEEKLYGSITQTEIAAALKEEGFEIDKNCVILEEPIKSLGIYEVPIKLHPEVSAKIKIWVVKK